MRKAIHLLGASILIFATSADVHADPAAAAHFQLVKAEPADEVALDAPPAAIRLWFSQEPEMTGARIRLLDAKDALVSVGEVVQDDHDPKMIRTSVEGSLQDGAYRIVWRAMAKDGHVVDGELSFSVATTR